MFTVSSPAKCLLNNKPISSLHNSYSIHLSKKQNYYLKCISRYSSLTSSTAAITYSFTTISNKSLFRQIILILISIIFVLSLIVIAYRYRSVLKYCNENWLCYYRDFTENLEANFTNPIQDNHEETTLLKAIPSEKSVKMETVEIIPKEWRCISCMDWERIEVIV